MNRNCRAPFCADCQSAIFVSSTSYGFRGRRSTSCAGSRLAGVVLRVSMMCVTGALSPPTYNPPHCYLNSTDSAHCSSDILWPHNVDQLDSSSCPTSKQSRRMFPSTTPQQLPRTVMQIHTYGGLRPAYPTRRLLLVSFLSVELNLTAVFTYSAPTTQAIILESRAPCESQLPFNG